MVSILTSLTSSAAEATVSARPWKWGLTRQALGLHALAGGTPIRPAGAEHEVSPQVIYRNAISPRCPFFTIAFFDQDLGRASSVHLPVTRMARNIHSWADADFP